MKPLPPGSLRISILVVLVMLFVASTGIAMRSIQSYAEPAWSVYGNQNNEHYGERVQSAGDVNGDGYTDVLIGAYLVDGYIFAYYGSTNGLPSDYQWSCSGYSFATAGDVNADGFDDVLVGIQTGRGRVDLYYGSADGLSQTPGWSASGVQAYEYFGRTVSSAGDVNGDGYADVVISAPDYTNHEDREGRLAVYYGSADGLAANPAWTYEPNIQGGHVGYRLTTGDPNGDGYGDLVVTITLNQSILFGFYGSETGFKSTYDWSIVPDLPHIGDLSLDGDINDDGFNDLLVGVYKYDQDPSVFVYLGSAPGLGSVPDFSLGAGDEPISFGMAVDFAGDMNLDGFDEMIVSAPLYYTLDGGHGVVYVYLGSSGGITPVPDWRPQGEIGGDSMFGSDLSGAGDVNGDQYDDFLVGAPTQSSNGYTFNGAAYLYSMPSPTPIPPVVHRQYLPCVNNHQP